MPNENSVPLAQWILRARTGTRDNVQNRAKLEPKPKPAHVGLWLDRCLIPDEAKGTASDTPGKPLREALYRTAGKALTLHPENAKRSAAVVFWQQRYDGWVEEWSKSAAKRPLRMVPLTTHTRLILHPSSGATVTEGAVLLHHTWGVPYIPGSALKGMCRAYAKTLSVTVKPSAQSVVDAGHELEEDWVSAMFGSERCPSNATRDPESGTGGLVVFHDALWIPELAPCSGGTKLSVLATDIVNPHHSSYYTDSDHDTAPSDTAEPIPTHFLTIAPRVQFMVVLEAIEAVPALKPWIDFIADHVLIPAAMTVGLGAKTTSGYGRLGR